MPVQEPRSLLLPGPTAPGVQLPFETSSIWIFRQAFCPSLPIFHAQELDDWRPNFGFRLSVRPLGFVCRRSNPKPAEIPYFNFPFLWLWLTMISSRKDACARALFIVLHQLHRSFSCPQLRQTRSGFFRQAFCPSLPVFQTQERQAFCPSLPVFQTQKIDDWRWKFPFRLRWQLIDWLLSAVFGEGARKHSESNQCEELNPDDTATSSSLDRDLPSLRHRALLHK